jgi:hypothetical protein
MRLHKHKVGGAVNGTSVAGEYTLDDGDEFTWTTQYIVPSNGTLRREPVSPDTTYVSRLPPFLLFFCQC